MIYLATPYSAAPATNYIAAMREAAYWMQEGFLVFSPIVHWHLPARACGLPGDADFWWGYNVSMLELATELWVITLPGWDTSKGVQMEIDWWTRERFERDLKYIKPKAQH
jgi:hypothetical protein